MKLNKIVMAMALSITLPLSAVAGDDPREDMIEARQSIMHLYAFSMGTLGAMAKGKMDYDAKAAEAAAKNLSLAAQLDQSQMWAPGTDNSVPDLKDKTHAKPDGWKQYEKISKFDADLAAAAEKLASVAGDGLSAIRANIGDVGKNCKGCHDIAKAK